MGKYLLGQLLSKFVSGLVKIVTFLLKMKDCCEILANDGKTKRILVFGNEFSKALFRFQSFPDTVAIKWRD